MVTFSEQSGFRRKPKLKRLQQVQEEIYRQMQLLIPDQVALHDSFVSRVNGSPLLSLQVLEHHPYTRFMRLTYVFDKKKSTAVPDAHIRLYEDARMAEVTAFDSAQGCRRSAHPWYPIRPLMERMWRENTALDKWLGYLLQQGHSFQTMRAAEVPATATADRQEALVAG